jgi:hypothetical protein
MNRILIILFSLLISFNSYGDWAKVGTSSGYNFYVDFDNIRISGNVFYFTLRTNPKPDKWGDMSSVVFNELDCKMPRKNRSRSSRFYTQTMGKGSPSETVNETQEWMYAPAGTMLDVIMGRVCAYVGQ